MKNPNGYGSVVKLSGNRRRPYAVRKTVGFNEKGHPIYICLGYTANREEGMLMLAEYNKDPYSIEDRNITAEELFKRWFSSQSEKMSKSMQGAMQAAWKHCTQIYETPYRTLNSYRIQECIDTCRRGYSTKQQIKNLFHHLDRFAMELDITTRERCLLVTAPKTPDTVRIPFSEEEIQLLWNNIGIEWTDTVLMFIYTGMRFSELLGVKADDIDLKTATIKGGVKTRAGKNRIIPIHPRIMPFIEKRLSQGGEYLISYNGKKCTTYRYYKEWEILMDKLSMSHTPHECRHTFRSRMDSAGANKRCIDLIMGHSSKDVGERVYTHKTVRELHEAISLMD